MIAARARPFTAEVLGFNRIQRGEMAIEQNLHPAQGENLGVDSRDRPLCGKRMGVHHPRKPRAPQKPGGREWGFDKSERDHQGRIREVP